MPFMCTQCRTKFTLKYLCFADVVNSDLHVAGTADLQNNGSSFQTLTEYSQTLPQLAGQTVVMPGVWFAKAGQLLEVNMHVEPQSSNNIVAVQVLRPTCHGRNAIRPGCDQNMFIKCGTQNQASNCTTPSCPSATYVCPLTLDCIQSSTPCSCAASASPNANCTNSAPDSDVTYTLVKQAVYEIPSSGGSFTAEIRDGIAVEAYDLLAFQSSSSSLGLCHTDSTSQWRQVAFLSSSHSWASTSQTMTLSSFVKQENYVCLVSAVYENPQTVSLPNNLAYMPTPGTYTFKAEVTGSLTASQSCSVEAVQEVGDLTWLHPTLSHQPTAVYVEVGMRQEFVVDVTSGSDLQVVWELDSGTPSAGIVAAKCPSSVPSHIGQCREPSSQLPYPFLIFEDTFSSTSPVTLTLNVSNSLGWKNMTVSVYGVEPIQNLVLNHSSCSGNGACSPLVEVGVVQKFFTSTTGGTVGQYEFWENGTVVETQPSPVLTRNFSAPGLYVMKVRASNSLESLNASLRVNAKVRAGATPLVLTPSSPVSVEVGKNATFAVIATIAPDFFVSNNATLQAKTVVAKNAELTITWDYGDGQTNSTAGQVTSDFFSADKVHAYLVTGSYTLLITVGDAFGVKVNMTATINVLSPVPGLDVSTSTGIVAAGNGSSVTAVVQPHTSNLGYLNYTFNFNDGSAAHVFMSTMTSESLYHVFTTNGTYSVSVSVKNEVSTATGSTTVVVQVCPAKVKLSYDGPKNLSEQLEFTADAKDGSDLHYSFNFGDGSSLLNQSSAVVQHTYNNSGTYNVTIVASNDVCDVYDHESAIAMDSTTLVVRRINHNCFAPLSTNTTFTVDVVTLDMQKVVLAWKSGVINQTFRATKKANFSFITVGNHTVSVTLTLDNGVSKSASTNISVQEEVSNVTMTAHNLVSYRENLPAEETFSAKALLGTDVTFDWYNNSVWMAQGSNVSLTMDTAGVFNISVMAQNEVSQVGDWQLLTVQHAVENVVITCRTCTDNKYMAKGTEASFQCSFLGTNASFWWRTGVTTTFNGSNLRHTYFSSQAYTVEVSVFNLVSRMNATLDLLVEEKISSLNVTADNSVTSEGASVQLTVFHTEGMNVEYSWQCDSQAAQATSVNTTAVIFPTQGLYSCNVTATNNVSFQQVSISIKVLQTISSLGVKDLAPNTTLYVPVGKTPSVEVDCNTYFEVNFTWNIMEDGAVIFFTNGTTLSYVFKAVDDYELRLEAVNAVSQKTVIVQVKALEEITNLRLSSNTTAMTVGAGVELSADIDNGTNPSYRWSLNNMSWTIVANQSNFSHALTSAGTYIVEVTVSNQLSAQTANVTILVQYPVQNIQFTTSLDFQHPYVSQNERITFCANVSQGSDPKFKWTVESPSRSVVNYTDDSLPQSFAETGKYSIQLVVSNTVSDINRNITVYVEKAINSLNLTVKPNTAVATGTTVRLWAEHNKDSTPVTYTWTVEGHNYSTEALKHTFQSAGFYILKLAAENNISRIEVNKTVQVEDPPTALRMADCNMTRRAGLTTLSATAQGTSVSFSWTVQLSSGNITTMGSSLTMKFPAGGSYPVHLLARNNVNNDSLTCMLKVQNDIANVSVQITDPTVDYIFTNQNVTFLATGSYLNDAEYTWNFSGLPTGVSSSPSYIASFATAQQITLTVLVKNDISKMQASVTFTVQDLQCNLPVVTPVGSSSRSILRSKSLQFDVYINNRGCTQYLAVHTWKIYDVADCTRTLPSTPLSLTSVEMNKPTLNLPAGRLPATISNFCVHYTMGYQRTPVAEEVFYNLTALASPLVAVISGGSWRQVDGRREVCMEGGLSYNPDSPKSGAAGMVFDWMCHTVDGSCFDPVTNYSSTLCKLLSEGTYNITQTVYLAGHAGHSTNQTLEVWRKKSVLSVGTECVSCQASNSYLVSSSQHTVLSAHCTGCTAPVTYSWGVTEDSGTSVVLGTADTSTGTTAANLVVLRSRALKDGHSYTFTINATDSNNVRGRAMVILEPNLPPRGGNCTVSPDNITVLEDLVTVSCSGWTDPDGDAELLYEIKAVNGDQSYLLYYGMRNRQSVYLAPWPGLRNSAPLLVVSVLDEYGAREEACRKYISFKDAGIPVANLSQELYLAANMTLTSLMQQGDPVPLLQYALALTQVLNSASTGSLQSEDQQTQALVRTAIMVCVSSISPVETLQQAQQIAYLLSLLTEFSAEYQTTGGHTLMLQSMQNIVTVLKASVQAGLDREDFAFPSLLSSVYHLMQAVSQDSSTTSYSSTTSTSFADAFPQLVSTSSRLGIGVQTLDFSTTALSTDHKTTVVSEAFTLAEDVTSVVLASLVLDEEKVTYQIGGMDVDGSRVTVGTVGSYHEQGGCSFTLPASMFPGLSSSDEVLRILIMLDVNPYTWGYIDQLAITSRVPTLSFKFANGSDMSISDLSSTIDILMFDSDNNTYTVTNASLLQNPHYNPLANGQFESWTLDAGLSKKLVVNPVMGTSGVSALHVQIRVEAFPNSTDSASGILPTAAIKAYLGAGFEASEESYTSYKKITTAQMWRGVDHRDYTFFVSAEDFRDTTEYTITLVNEDTDHDVNITAAMYLSSCQYYQESSRTWSAAGCSVSDESIPLATLCHCNHLTAFGSGSLLPISSIRFSDLAGLELGLNPVTLVAVGTILLIYIIGVIVCRHLDRWDLQRISVVPLCGRDGIFRYEITVLTGRHVGAGTTAHVGMKLYGDNSKSEPRHLTKRSGFQRNSRDTFLIASDNDLGNLHKMKIWHDNTGSSPCWYLTQVQVHDLQSGQRYIFPANSWLSLEVEEGVLHKELYVAAPEELQSFSRVFHTSFSHNMAERHMWLSVINRPDHSRFTRVQRATCCVTLVYLFMFFNAMWYGLIKDKSDANDSISWKVIGWEEFIIAVVSAVAIFPVALILIFIFKRSRSKANMFSHAMRPQSAQTLEIDAMCDMSQYGGSLCTMTPNEDWNTIFERESTTESIPPISSQLRRTAVRSSKDFGSGQSIFPGSGMKSTVQSIRRTQDLMWNQENILKSWPEKLPSFAEEEKVKPTSKPSDAVASTSKTTSRSIASKINKTTSLTSESASATALKKTKSAPEKATEKSADFKTGGKDSNKIAPLPVGKPGTPKKDADTVDEHEEFMQRLDEIDRELEKSASARSRVSTRGSKTQKHPQQAPSLLKKHSSRSSQGAIEELFDSDDEWANEGVDAKAGGRRVDGSGLNHRQLPNMDRRASVTSLMRMRAGIMMVPGSAGSSFLRRDSTFRRESTLHSFIMSDKSRTSLSILRHRMHSLSGSSDDSRCRLPWFCVYIAYGICVGLSILSMLMVLLYGYNFGSAIALRWLLSVLIAFIFSIFILEPLKVMILTLYVAVIVKDAEKDVESGCIDVMASVESNEQLKEVKFRPLGGFALIQARDEGRKKTRLRTMIRQAFAYLLLTGTLLAVANVYFGPALYRASDHLENSVVYTNTSTPVYFYNISSTDVFWDWARDVLTPGLYRRELVPNEENPLLLGPARLRQIRSTLVGCLTDEVKENRSCIGRLEFTEDTATYSEEWLNMTSGNASWFHSSAEQLDTLSKFGQDLLYTGGGYVQELGTSYNQTLDTLQQLRDSLWLDRKSRALFIEWTSYSAAEDLFSAATLLLEFPISGGVLASHTINTQRLHVFDYNRVDPVFVCQVLLLVPAIYLLVQTVMAICQQKSKFLRCPGNWLQMISALLCLACIAVYVACAVIATDTLDRFSTQWTSFTNFDRPVHLHELLRLLHACLLFLLFLKIAGQVRFIQPLSVYPRTLATAFGRLAGATFIFLVLLLTYTQLGYLFYGRFVHSYRSFQNSLMTLFGVMKGRVDFSPVLEYQPVFSHFFFYSFYVFVYGLFVALVIAILQDAYKLIRSQMYFKATLESQDYEMIEFMIKRFKLWAGITKPKPAFRRVKFEGLPSLPSRSSSSAASSWRPLSQNSLERNTPTPDLIASMNTGDALDRLLPAWERLLTLLGTMEVLEKEEQRQVGRVQIACNRWSSEEDNQTSLSQKKKGGVTARKPPLDPKSRVSRFKSNFEEQSSPKVVQRQSLTPPAFSSPNRPGAAVPKKPMVRTLSDQGAKSFGMTDRPDTQKVQPAPDAAGNSGTPVTAVRPGSESPMVRSSSDVPISPSRNDTKQPAVTSEASGDTDAFPGSSSQRSRQSKESLKINPASKPQPGTSGTGKKVPGFSVRQPATLSDSTDDSKKEAWGNG
ncbi:polycystin-1-like [Littorina saxatilis]|uniref:polycystin-1-like n=1 Tax=Littorina saxatilis TaxID=31220 RepID=UPI0038B696B7